ncbi:hypothetical protein BHE74_00048302 [Ensete ventricosum]|nr:hypothetical protein GW17_00032912 [Ensete ventricosum]RWW45845.1 hypothetical protein BHE74_00048302 [Ensete ventricosum]RZS20954.1 hypothetical protein BHM03_00053534 [Ensete ventricosum]
MCFCYEMVSSQRSRQHHRSKHSMQQHQLAYSDFRLWKTNNSKHKAKLRMKQDGNQI